MKHLRLRPVVAAIVLGAAFTTVPSFAAAPRASASAAPPQTARPLASDEQSAGLPPGHPALDQAAPGPVEGDEELPPGHPPMGAGAGQMPAGHAQVDAGGTGGLRAPPASTTTDDPNVPVGTIRIELRDENDKPVAGQDVVLGIVVQSIAQGEQRKRLAGKSDAQGVATFSSLDTASQVAYRVSTVRDGATYAATPFRLPTTTGERVVLRVFPVTHDVEKAQIAIQGVAIFELRDEVIKVEQHYRIFNVGTTTWVPDDLSLTLPSGWKAFQAPKSMSDVAWDAEKTGVKLRGSLPPGLTETTFQYQLPTPSADRLDVDFDLPPNVQSYRVIVEAPKGLTMTVDGFPQAVSRMTEENQRFLVTEKETSRLDPSFRKISMHLGNMPTRGSGRWIAVALAIAGVAAGIHFARAGRERGGDVDDRAELEEARAKLLDELRALEKARATGEVGPKTYEAARKALIDALARLLASQDEQADAAA